MNNHEERHLICIGCPMGCHLAVVIEQGQIKTVRGFTCARGERYARDEVMQPRRMVTGLVVVPGSRTPLSVKTKKAIPKELITACLEQIRRLRPKLPVRIGDVVLTDVLNTGVDIIATRNLPETDQ